MAISPGHGEDDLPSFYLLGISDAVISSKAEKI